MSSKPAINPARLQAQPYSKQAGPNIIINASKQKVYNDISHNNNTLQHMFLFRP